MQLKAGEHNEYYNTYTKLVPEEKSIVENLAATFEKTMATFANISEERGNYRYAPEKWSIKGVLSHIIDTERVMSYRALCIARNDKTALPGFDQDVFANSFDANERTLESLLGEFKAVRLATIALFDSFSEEMLLRMGTASSFPCSTRALGCIIIGHELHHMNIVKERYL